MTSAGITLVALLLASGAFLFARGVRFNPPGIDQGYGPRQPLEFSHRLHCGELEMRCLYCHTAADESRHAGLPSASVCMNCHRFVTSSRSRLREGAQAGADGAGGSADRPVSSELGKLYAAVGFDPATGTYTGSAAGRPIEWIQVHDLPDFAHFEHQRHVNAGVDCERCHGSIASMERVSQVSTLGMGWCVNCHRDVNAGRIPELRGRSASTDCGACHY